jgi:hypothetical protein
VEIETEAAVFPGAVMREWVATNESLRNFIFETSLSEPEQRAGVSASHAHIGKRSRGHPGNRYRPPGDETSTSSSISRRMDRVMKITRAVFLALATACLAFFAQASELLFSQSSDGQSAYGLSELWPSAGINSEAADDFEAIGNIDRVFASGFVWGTVDFQGVYVRFYAYGAEWAGVLLPRPRRRTDGLAARRQSER